MIVKPSEMKFENKRIIMIIAGVPGIGKTTLALSSEKPLLVDLDNGISRVEGRYRTDSIQVDCFDELMDDLKNSDLTPYETIVIDTGGKLLEMMKPVVISDDPKNGKRDGNLSLQGYGAIKRKFASFINFVKTLKKDMIIVFHATEVALANDITGLRIRMEGSSKDDVWDDVDIGGFIEVNGKKRTIGFSNCERYYAKGTHSIHGVYELPRLEKGDKNDFVKRLFATLRKDLNDEVEELNKYNQVMDTLKPVINKASNKDELNSAYEQVKTSTHHLTSKDELWFALNEKAKSLGLKYDKGQNLFI